MALESGTYISDLNPSNPVGATDKVSTLDDHVRLVKATLQTTFPGISGAVTATHTELNHLDGVTGTTGTGKLVLDNAPTIADLTVTDSITLPAKSIADAALSSNVPLKDAAVAFESTLSVAGAATFSSTIAVTGNATIGGNLTLTGTLNGVNVTDFARLSQANEFKATIEIDAAQPRLMFVESDADENEAIYDFIQNAGTLFFRTRTDADGSGQIWLQVDRSGTSVTSAELTAQTITLSGSTRAATIANSTSTTLAVGQIHGIDGNATLPNMGAGQWVGVVNNGASNRTVTKSGSDTMYWTATGASVTTVTVAARGKATFYSPDGTNVYASGNIIGAS